MAVLDEYVEDPVKLEKNGKIIIFIICSMLLFFSMKYRKSILDILSKVSQQIEIIHAHFTIW